MGRKKVCIKCKRKLWMRDFYKHKSYYSSKCKDCTKEEMRMEYAEKKKVPDSLKDYTWNIKDIRHVSHGQVICSVY